MSNSFATKPASSEYAPHYERYVTLVPETSIIETLRHEMEDTLVFIHSLSDEIGNHRYAAGKWSIKEVIGHVIDTERIFCYRALRFARNDKTALPGFDQDAFVKNAHFDQRQLTDLAREYEQVRKATIEFFQFLAEEAWNRRGIANNAEASVRALAWIIAGHEMHHKQVLRTRYL